MICECPLVNPTTLRKAKIVCNFGISECSGVKVDNLCLDKIKYKEILDSHIDVRCVAHRCFPLMQIMLNNNNFSHVLKIAPTQQDLKFIIMKHKFYVLNSNYIGLLP